MPTKKNLQIFIGVLILIFFQSCGVVKTENTIVQFQDKNEKLQIAIQEFINLAVAKNINEINKQFIYPPYKLIDIYRIGVPDVYQVIDCIPTERTKAWTVYYDVVSITKPDSFQLINKYPEYDCSLSEWSDTGIFYSDSLSYPLMSEIDSFYLNYESIKPNPKLKSQITFIEQNSVRVVITQADFVAYFTWINNHWYLTVIDRVTTDCSA